MIGIIASMEEELNYIKESMEDVKIKNINNTDYVIGNLHGKDVVVVRCFTGKVYMALTAQKLIDNFDLDLIINCGVAGGLKDGMHIGDVVLATNAIQSDMDVRGLGYEIGQVPDIEIKDFKQYEKINETSKEFVQNYDFKVYFGNIMTADKFVSSKEDKEYLIEQFDGYCTDMETASLGEVCYVNKINFAGIRGISDSADEGANTDFRENLKKASDNCAILLCDIIKVM